MQNEILKILYYVIYYKKKIQQYFIYFEGNTVFSHFLY